MTLWCAVVRRGVCSLNPARPSAAWTAAALSSSEQRQWGLQAGVNPILEWMHRVAQQRRSTRESVQQTRALLNERRCRGFRCQSSGQLRRASCRRPLARYPPAGRLEVGIGTMASMRGGRCHARVCGQSERCSRRGSSDEEPWVEQPIWDDML